MELEIAGLRAMIYDAAQTQDRMVGLERVLAEEKLSEEEQVTLKRLVKQQERYVRELTPLIKYWGAEKAVEISRKALQVHGGYGIFEAYEVERHLRDSIITAIYEGTSQIQSLMSLKDQLNWTMSRPQAFLKRRLAVKGAKTKATGVDKMLFSMRDHISSAIQFLVLDMIREKRREARRKGQSLSWLQLARQGKSAFSREDLKHFSYALLNAERLSTMLSHYHCGRLLKAQADRSGNESRARLAARYIQRRAPVVGYLAECIRSGERSTLEFIREDTAGGQ